MLIMAPLKECRGRTNEVRRIVKRLTFKPFILPLLMAFCTLFYYFGELVDWAAWDALRQDFFYGIHDIHRLLFLAPIIYAGHTARIKGAVIVTLVSFAIFLPRAFFISPYADPLLRMILFTVFAGVIGVLHGSLRNHVENAIRLEAAVTRERNNLLKVVDGMADGICIIGPDYRIRFMNSYMEKDFGEGTGLPCYQHLRGLDAPCEPGCGLSNGLADGETIKWQCQCPEDRTYDAVATPYVDTDGVVCRLAVFRRVA
jgi:hypothetical protein